MTKYIILFGKIPNKYVKNVKILISNPFTGVDQEVSIGRMVIR